jgi:hypothetical protein
MSISIEEQIKFLQDLLNDEWDSFSSGTLEHFEAIKQTLEAELLKRQVNDYDNGVG